MVYLWHYTVYRCSFCVICAFCMALYGINELESCSAIYIKNLRTVSNAREWCYMVLLGLERLEAIYIKNLRTVSNGVI